MDDLLGELKALLARLRAAQIEYALCGGLAMAMHAFPRATVDIDILIQPEILEDVKAIASDLGYTFDAGLMRFKGGVVQIYRVSKMLPGTSFPLVLDLLLVTPPLRQVWETRQILQWEDDTISVVSVEGLIDLKQLRLSEQDQADIAKLRKTADES